MHISLFQQIKIPEEQTLRRYNKKEKTEFTIEKRLVLTVMGNYYRRISGPI